MTVSDLAVDHDYYASESNYYSNGAGGRYDTMTDFLDAFDDADIDLNLVYRWDVRKRDDGSFYAEVFMIMQRKGIYSPFMIKSIKDEEVDRFVSYLKKHKEKLDSIWSPL